MNSKKIKEDIKNKAGKVLQEIKSIETATERQLKDTYLASEILLHLCKGNEASEAQIEFLKGQSVNLGKALALIGLQAVPGSSVAIVILEKSAEKHGFSLFPVALEEPEMPEESRKRKKGNTKGTP
ncbi:hypothetical protein ACI6Q2_18770 [Chitinophagaceae bacterium LWZ2-11]